MWCNATQFRCVSWLIPRMFCRCAESSRGLLILTTPNWLVRTPAYSPLVLTHTWHVWSHSVQWYKNICDNETPHSHNKELCAIGYHTYMQVKHERKLSRAYPPPLWYHPRWTYTCIRYKRSTSAITLEYLQPQHVRKAARNMVARWTISICSINSIWDHDSIMNQWIRNVAWCWCVLAILDVAGTAEWKHYTLFHGRWSQSEQ